MSWFRWCILTVVLSTACSTQESSNCVVSEESASEKVERSKNLSIQELSDGAQLVKISLDGQTHLHQTFILGSQKLKKEHYAQCDNFIETPVKRMVVFSATHAYMLDTLGSLDLLCAFSKANYSANQDLHDGVASGKIKELGDYSTVDIEALILLKPDVVMISGFDDQNPRTEQLQKAGIPVIENLEWKESHPLGRSEWVKLFGALAGKFNKSVEVFNGINNAYTRLLDEVKRTTNTYTGSFLYGIPYNSSWDVPGQKSFMNHLFKDANIDYPWPKNSLSGSSSLDFEYMAKEHLKDSIWVHPGMASIEDIVELDERFSHFNALKGSIYHCDKKVGYSGNTWYWEESVLRCDKLLQDFVEIFHHGGRSKHLYFFRRIR